MIRNKNSIKNIIYALVSFKNVRKAGEGRPERGKKISGCGQSP